jgi:hypothetical protein
VCGVAGWADEYSFDGEGGEGGHSAAAPPVASMSVDSGVLDANIQGLTRGSVYVFKVRGATVVVGHGAVLVA